MKSNKFISINWSICQEYSTMASNVSRIVVLGFLIINILLGQSIKLIAVYCLFDILQYFLSYISYHIVARRQELKKCKVFPRPAYVNFCGVLCFLLKHIVVFILLGMFLA